MSKNNSFKTTATGELSVTLNVLHPGQKSVLDEARRFNVLRCGRRWGKSTLARWLAVHEAARGGRVCWVSPFYKDLAPQWRELCNILGPLIESKNEEEKHVELTGRGHLDGWSAESGTPAEGRFYSLLVFDEAAKAGAQLESLWTRSLRPTLADLRGSAWFLSTSKGANAYFNTLFAYGQGEREDWKSWQRGTIENPYIPASEVAEARTSMPAAAFAQEWLGDAVSFSGTVFTGLERAIRDVPLDQMYIQASPRSYMTRGLGYPGGEYSVGVDWAGAGRRAGGDWTAFVVMSSDGTVVAIERMKADFGMQRIRLQGLIGQYRPMTVLAESNSIGAPQLSELRASGLHVQGFTTTNSTKAAIVEHLALAFEQNQIKLPDIPNRAVLLAELMAFEATSLRNGMTRYAAAKGSHDDLTMAMMLAWWAWKRPAGGPRPGWVA